MNRYTYSFAAPVVILFTSVILAGSVSYNEAPLTVSPLSAPVPFLPADTDSIKPVKLRYPFEDQSMDDPMYRDESPLFLDDPSNINTSISYDPDSGLYYIDQKMGNFPYRPPTYMDMEEYARYDMEKKLKEYWKQRTHAENLSNQTNKNGFNPKLYIKGQLFGDIFGGNTVDIRPQGSAELTFGVNISKTDNPSIPEKQRRLTTFDFNEKIQLNVIGKIGEKLKLTTTYNTEATFDYENQMKLEYTGFEDDIIKKIEAGNVSLPLSGTLITGSTSLFGIKTQLQFGRLTVTNVFSQQKGKKSEIEVTGGATTNAFEVNGDNYEANKHYFLAQYFRDHYESALANLPVIVSGISITKLEVWITNTSGTTTDTRNIVAFTDLGEEIGNQSTPYVIINPGAPANTPPQNSNNVLNPATFANASVRDINNVAAYLGNPLNFSPPFASVSDFEKVTAAKKLSPNEYYFNDKLGYISLNSQLNPDQVLAVAFQYTLNGDVFQVGEFSTDGIQDPSALMVKMLKSTNVSTRRDTLMWDLMMKNVYAIGAYQVKPDDFKLDVLYNNPSTGTYVNVIPENNIAISGKPLLQVLNMDNINQQLSNSPDGIFDFLDKITINASNGRVYFPVVEPFGDYLRDKINPNNDPNLITIENKYAYDQLYDSSKTAAQQFPDKNRFIIRGSYKSASGSEISLNASNIPQGSVTVTAGGVPLQENLDYTIDYALGRVKIINEGILQSGTPIKISLESNSLFSIQSKTMIGTRAEYRVSRDLQFGMTWIRLNEKPLTAKVNINDEPIKNNVLGLDGNYRTDAQWLTRLIDKFPLIATKEMSTITTSFEVAKLFPGHSKAIGKDGNAYLDDFEGSQTNIDIKSVGAWTLASVPQFQESLFPEANEDSVKPGMNRALLAWYVIDPILLRTTDVVTSTSMQSNNLIREILETELFPNKQSPTGQPINIPTLDLAFYPNEVGPYNYDSKPRIGLTSGIDANGNLNNPVSRWGGIMRKIETNDFEAANVEYIQFWVMDPFVRDQNGNSTDYISMFNSSPPTSGFLYINIGNVSEDILKDGRKSFENGFPNPNSPSLPTTTTSWGNVPTTTPIVNAFDNSNEGRTAQDIGLDGLPDADPNPNDAITDERTFFTYYLNEIGALHGTNSPVYQNLIDATGENGDVSHDYYHHFRGDYDNQQYNILRRYKFYNGMEGNSPIEEGNNGYTQSSTTIPNTEDVNRDNNLNETESYYQYKISVNPNDINPNAVGTNYITSVYQASTTAVDGSQKVVNWYQFKIPLNQFEKIGNIEDFKSIRFIRMFMKGFDKPIVMRFAKLDLVRGEWRKYNFDLLAPGEYLPIDNTSGTTFDVSAVNFEENGSKSPVNYILPPDIEQETDITTANLVKLNEQALSLRVCQLKDGDARACYKNVSLDVRSYKKLKMYVHAEAGPNNEVLNDGDLKLFVRLGTDYTSNYYEYEIPLYVTAPGYYNNNDDGDKRKVWRIENDMILSFADLQTAKQERNSKMAITGSGVGLNTEYTIQITDENGNQRTIRVKGNPNLSTIKTIMIGVRNSKKLGQGDDGLDKCAEVWVNELRLTDFDEVGGWAATSHVTMKLADFGSLTLAGNLSTPGWGSLEKKVSERKKETVLSYDIISQFELGKFFPQKWGIRLPLYYGFSETRINPQYNPYDPDIELKNVYDNPNFSDQYKDSIRNAAQDYTRRKSINLTNIKKERDKGDKDNDLWDVENFALNFSYSELFNRSYSVKHYLTKDFRGGLTYNFNATPKPWKPLEKKKFFKPKSLTIFREFNLSPYPNSFAFVLDVDRFYSERLMRDITGEYLTIDTTFQKHFNINRGYDLRWDLAKSLKLQYSADNTGLVREPDGKIDTEHEKDSLRDQFYRGGTTTTFHQGVKVDWTIPINKLPLFDWITANASYGGDYQWSRSSALAADTLGALLTNSQNKTLNTQFNMLNFYNKVKYFKKVNTKFQKKNVGDGKTPPKTPPKSPSDTTGKKKTDTEINILDYIVRGIMMVRNVSFSVTNSEGTILPGYKPTTNLMGMNISTPFNGTYAPGLDFVLGGQNDVHWDMANEGLLSTSYLGAPYVRNYTLNYNGRANIEPFNNFKVELTANRNYSRNRSMFFVYDPIDSIFEERNVTEGGNFSMSFFTLNTAFSKLGKDFSYAPYEKFRNARAEMSALLAGDNGNSTGVTQGFYNGYGSTAQYVLMYSFLAGYSGNSINQQSRTPFPSIPKPNWRVTYDGLSKVKFFKKYFKTISLSHAYRSSYSFSFTQNLNYAEDANGAPSATDASGNFIFKQQISAVTVTEQFSPLIKVDVTMNNKITANFEIKKDRNMSLSLTNSQVTEVFSRDFIIGAGYRIPDLQIKFSKKKNAKKFKSDLNLKVDLSIRNNVTVIRKVVENVIQPTAGQTVVSIKTSADYVLSERLNLRIFYDQLITRPVISTSYNSSNTNAGIALRFTL